MIDDEVPKSFASVIGHVCGVIAVGMTASTLFGVWALARKPTVAGFFFVSTAVALGVSVARPPTNLDAGLIAVAGVASSLSISYLCYLAYHRFK